MNSNKTNVSNGAVIDNLIELGLTRHEALVYLSVLTQGECSAGVVLNDVKLHREQVYRALKRLVGDGFLTQFEKRKRAYYSAIDPSILVKQANEKVAVAQSLQPFLKDLHQKKPQIIKVTEGEEAVKLQLEDMVDVITQNGEYLVLGGIGELYYEATGKYLDQFAEKFAKKNIKGRILIYEGSKYSQNPSFGEHLSIQKIKRAGLFPASTVIYGNKVGIDLLDPESIAIITIENEKVADSYRQTFEALWR